jgi:hypothetical protein
MNADDGYDRLAALFGQHQGVAIFRRFSSLGAKNLLHRQAELVHLEAQLQKLICDDRTSNDPEKMIYQYSVFELLDSQNNPHKNHQWQKAIEVRGKLEEYCKAAGTVPNKCEIQGRAS